MAHGHHNEACKKEIIQSATNLELCPICNDDINIFAIGACDHPVCIKCSVRMKVLCEDNNCAICRHDIRQVAMVTQNMKFDKINMSSLCMDGEHKIFSESQEIQQTYHNLLIHKCTMCEPSIEFKSFNDLRHHVSKKHNRIGCKLCNLNLKLFTSERKFYEFKDIARHNKYGDPEDKSYKGHPLCEFCDVRYFDKDALNFHLRKDHYYCHFCETDGILGNFYCVYEDLKEHFKAEHFLCEEGECANKEMTNSFRNDIDYNAHMAVAHSNKYSRQEIKSMLNVNLVPGENSRWNEKKKSNIRRENAVYDESLVRCLAVSEVTKSKVGTVNRDMMQLMRGQANYVPPATTNVNTGSINLSLSAASEFPSMQSNVSQVSSTMTTSKNKFATIVKHFEISEMKPTVHFPSLPKSNSSNKQSNVNPLQPHLEFSKILYEKKVTPKKVQANNQVVNATIFPSLPSNERSKETQPSANVWSDGKVRQKILKESPETKITKTLKNLPDVIKISNLKCESYQKTVENMVKLTSKEPKEHTEIKKFVPEVRVKSMKQLTEKYKDWDLETCNIIPKSKIQIIPETLKEEVKREQSDFSNMKVLRPSKTKEEFPSLLSKKLPQKILKVTKKEDKIYDNETSDQRLARLVLVEKNEFALSTLKIKIQNYNQGVIDPEDFYASCVKLLSKSLVSLVFKDIAAGVKSGKERAKLVAVHQMYA